MNISILQRWILPAIIVGDSSITGNGAFHAVLLTPVLRKTAAVIKGKNVVVTFDAVAGHGYSLQQTTDVTNPNWQSVPGVSDFVATSTGSAQFTYSNGLPTGKAYYRVQLLN